MYQILTVAQHDLSKELLGLRIVLKYNPIDEFQPIIETSLDSEFGTVRISEVLEDESLLLNEIRDVYFEIREYFRNSYNARRVMRPTFSHTRKNP